MFCVECGKEGKIYKNGVCVDCYIKNKSFTKGPNIIDIYKCSKCPAFKYKNSWLNESFEKVLIRYVKDNFRISTELKKIDIKTDCDEEENNISCKITMSGLLDDHEISEEHFLKVRIKRIVCDVCSKQFGGYYEAILQIRSNKRKSFKKELKKIRLFVENFVGDLVEKGNRGLFITDISEEQNGIDFYISEKGPAHTIAKKIQEKFGGEIKQSSKNIGMKDSKQIYRITYLVRLPGYSIGDFFSYNNSFFYIYSITGDNVHVFELHNWTKRVFKGKELLNINIFGGKELIKEMILISQSKDEVQVMDPKTFKTFDVKKPKDIYFDSKAINIVNLEDRNFIILKKTQLINTDM